MTVNDFITYTFSNIFMSLSIVYSFSKISNKKLNLNFINIILIIISSLILTLNNYYNVSTFKLILALLITLTRELIIFKMNVKETFIITIILTILSILIEILSLPLMAIKVSNVDILNNEVLFKLLYSIANALILLFVINRNKFIKFLQKIISAITNFMNFYTISVIFICMINIVVYAFGTNIRNSQLTIVIIISILMLLFCLRTIVNDKNNNKLLLQKNQILKDEHKAYSNTIDECRELKHNLKNELYSIKAKLSKDEQNLINSIITKYNNNCEWINTLNDIPEGLQGLVYLKIHEAKLKKIKIFLNTKSSLKTQENDYLDLCNTLGILIDNSIEASKTAKSKNIVINITEEKNNINIEIINKFINMIDINEIGKKNYSTKEYKSGLGLNFINKLNKKDIKVNFKITNDLFITKLLYFNKK